MNPCACEERLTSWLLGDLSPAETDALRRHVADCATCRNLASELEPVVVALQQGFAATPAQPLQLEPSRRCRVLAMPCRSRFRRWWSAPHPVLRLAAAIVFVLGCVLAALLPAGGGARRRAEMTSGRSEGLACEALADFEPMPDPCALPERSAAKAQPARQVVNKPADLSFSFGLSGATDEMRAVPPPEPSRPTPPSGPPPAPSQPGSFDESSSMSPQPAAFDSVAIVKSPVILRGLYGSRSAGARGEALRRAESKEEARPDAGIKAGELSILSGAGVPPQEGDIEVEVVLPESEDRTTSGRAASPAAQILFDQMSTLGGGLYHAGTAEARSRRRAPAARPGEQPAAEVGATSVSAAGGIVIPASERIPAAHHPFVETRANPFSTFAIDVDTASYTLTRQALTGGALPDPETVRTEEIVNAFDYGDRAPETAVFRVYVEGVPAPFAAGLDLVRIGVKGRRLGREEQRPAMLTFLVDASGSMDQPDRIGLARQALTLLLEQLAPHDRLQLIAFDDRARLLLEPTAAGDRDAVLAAFDRLQCRGSTNLEDGMREAYALAARAFRPGAENRVILLSDGVANLGADSAADILAQIEAYRRQGITCTVFGVGRGAYNDRMLEELANRGDGAYRFLDSPAEVRRAFVDDLAATLNTIAADVKIQVEWAPDAVSRYRPLGYENRALTKEQFRDDTVDAGEVGSGQSVTALYEIERSGPASRDQPLGRVRVRYRRVDTQTVEEIEQAILPRDLAPRFEAARPELRLAACAAEFAELLRRSPHAAGGNFSDVARLLRPVALEMRLDTRVAELARLVEMAQAMGD